MKSESTYLKKLKFTFAIKFEIKKLKNSNYNIRCKLVINSYFMNNIYTLNIFGEFFDNLTYVAPVYNINIIRKKNKVIYVTNGYPQKLIDEIQKIGFNKITYKYNYKRLENLDEYKITGDNIYDIDIILTKLFKSDASSYELVTISDLV